MVFKFSFDVFFCFLSIRVDLILSFMTLTFLKSTGMSFPKIMYLNLSLLDCFLMMLLLVEMEIFHTIVRKAFQGTMHGRTRCSGKIY